MNRTTLVVAAMVMGIGCGSDDAKPAPPPPPGLVTVLAPGTEPRRVLRYHVAPDARATLTAELDVSIDAGGQAGDLPTMVLGLETVVEQAQPGDRARVRTTIAAVSSRERPNTLVTAAAMDAEAHHLRGIAFVGRLAPDGELGDVTVDLGGRTLPPALASQVDSLAKTFQQVAMPLPAVAVGVGARWRYEKRIDQGGMKLTATTDVQLSALDGDRLSFVMTSTLAGADQAVTQAGTTIRLTHIGGEGKGTGVVDLARMTMTGEQSMVFHADMAGTDQNAHMGMRVTTRIHDGAAPAPTAPADAGLGEGSGDTGSDDNATLEDH